MPLSTLEAARHVGVSGSTVYHLLRVGAVPRPPCNSSGDLAWGKADLANLKAALAARVSASVKPRQRGPTAKHLLDRLIQAGMSDPDERVSAWFKRLKAGGKEVGS